jgi:hypothetical protein
MANNLIQIKKSLTTALPTSLANGEMAYTANGDVLYIGSNNLVEAIGGRRNPGVLTANQALVTNSTSYIDSVKTANLVTTKIYANGAHGTTGQIIVANSTGGLFWTDPTSGIAGSDTQVQFNNAGTLAGSAGFTFTTGSNTLNVSNTITVGANVSLNTSVLNIGNSTVNTVINSSSVSTNSVSGFTVTAANAVITKIYANSAHGTTGQLLTANSTGGIHWASPATEITALNDLTDVAVSSATTGQILVANSTGFFRNVSLSGDVTIDSAGVATISADATVLGTDTTGDYVATITAGDGISGSGTGEGSAPTIAVVAGTGVVSNATGVHIGQAVGTTSDVQFGIVNAASHTVGSAFIANSTAIVSTGFANIATSVNSAMLTVGTAFIANSTAIVGTGYANITGSVNASSHTVGTDFIANSTGAYHTGLVNAASFRVGTDFIANSTVVTMNNDVTVGSSSADSVTVNAGVASSLVPSANVTYDLGTSAKRWKDLYLAGSTITIGTTSISATDGTLSIGNTSAAEFSATGNTIIGSDSSDVVSIKATVNTDIIPNANVTYSLGNNANRYLKVFAQNVHSEYLYIDKDVNIVGNLVVSGSLVTINVATLAVTDSLIQLASNNLISDTLDIGFFGSYQSGADPTEHTGFFRDATDGKFRLFDGLQTAPTTTVDIGAGTYNKATLVSFIEAHALVSNSTAVTLTANSTVAVNITANSISLGTALPGTSGGTGLSTIGVNEILVGNATNTYSKLSLGSEGFVLQSNGTALVYATLDGGTF